MPSAHVSQVTSSREGDDSPTEPTTAQPGSRELEEAVMESAGTNVVKVFSATRARDRESIGERVTSWLRDHPGVTIGKTVVRLSSDREFHCLSIVLIGHELLTG